MEINKLLEGRKYYFSLLASLFIVLFIFFIIKVLFFNSVIKENKQLAKDNTSVMSNISFWFLSPTAQTQYEDIYRKCMINRGHSVLN